MSNFTVPDICDLNDDIRIGDLFLNSYGAIDKFYGEVFTAKCEHSNSVVKEIVQKDEIIFGTIGIHPHEANKNSINSEFIVK